MLGGMHRQVGCQIDQIRHYLSIGQKDVYLGCFRQLRDTSARIAIDRRLNRVELGNLGDHQFCRDGVGELRMDVGAGYRIDYGVSGKEIILLLCGGDKRTQDADIGHACGYWSDWQRRMDDER